MTKGSRNVFSDQRCNYDQSVGEIWCLELLFSDAAAAAAAAVAAAGVVAVLLWLWLSLSLSSLFLLFVVLVAASQL